MGVDKDFQIKVLSVEEAWDLLKKKVGDYVDSRGQQLHDTAYEICRECQGLPIVILTVAATLQGKDIYAWENARDLMKESMLQKIEGIDPKVYSTLKWSYDMLESEDAKSCFLLCCLFPEDAQIPIEDLARHYVARRLLHPNPVTVEKVRRRVRTIVDTLKTSCLLLEGNEENYVKMHDVIRDVAISIARDDKELHFLVHHGVQEWYEKDTYEHCSAISLSSKTIRELPNELVCPQLHTLLLDWSSSDFWMELPDKFFNGMEKLAVLDLKCVSMLLVLPSSLAKLQELRMLCLNGCKLGDIAKLRDLKDKLEILSLRNSDIKALPPEVGELTHLRLLDLGDCGKLSVIPKGVISELSSRLEELYIPHTFDKWEATAANKEGSNVSLDEITSLTRLTTLEIHIPNVMLLPEGLDHIFKKLIWFKISVGSPLQWFESSSSRRILKLEGVPLKDEFNVLLDRAEVLYLNKLKGLNKVLHDRVGEGFLNLKHLEIQNCDDDWEHLIGEPKQLMPSLDPSRPFCNLTKLIIVDCKFKYLFSPSCARGLLQLQKLEIRACEIMEEVIGTEGEKDEEKFTNTVSLSQLKYLTLDGLPNLVSFCTQKERAATTEGSSSSHAQSLFNEKVALPALEEVEIVDVPNITGIWDKKLLPAESFCRLQSLKVTRCDKLVNVGPSNVQFTNLEVVLVCECLKMEVILDNSEEKKRASSTDNMILLPKLWSLTLENLKSLIGFCTSRSVDHPLFNSQVALPALEEVEIVDVPNITGILDKKLLPVESFCRLQSLKVTRCDKLVNVGPSNVQFTNLEVVLVCECLKMEVILDNSEEEKRASSTDNMILLPKLRSLTLENLKSLIGFCTSRSEDHPLFNSQVALPALEKVEIVDVPNITEIWDKKLLPAKSFRQLQSLMVTRCEKLVNVVPSNVLPRLPNLEVLVVCECLKMEVILDDSEEEKKVTSTDSMILLPKLRSLTLVNLKNLVGFCPTKSEDHPFFNSQVALPALEKVQIVDVPNITEIWDKKLLPAKSFSQLQSLKVTRCEKLVNVVPSNVLPRLSNLEVLLVCECLKMEAILDNSEEEKKVTSTDNMILLPKLRSLTLDNLKNLVCFCTTRSEDHPLFNSKVALPQLKDLTLVSCVNPKEIHLWRVLADERGLNLLSVEECDQVSTVVLPFFLQRLQNLHRLIVRNCQWEREDFQLEELVVGEGQRVGPFSEPRRIGLDRIHQLTFLWNKEPRGLVGLLNLQYLVIKDCSLLRNLFTSSVATALEQLKVLYLSSCPAMQEVIATDEGHKEIIDEIVFPKLEWLILDDLSNLKSFCSADCDFNFPSLKRVAVKGCPKMQTFSSGSLCMPQMKLHTGDNDLSKDDDFSFMLKGEDDEFPEDDEFSEDEWLEIDDFNKYLEQRLVK